MKTIEQIKFPVGYHEFNKDKAFNFQLNRWYSMGYARFEDVKTVGNRMQSFDDWKTEMLGVSTKYLNIMIYIFDYLFVD